MNTRPNIFKELTELSYVDHSQRILINLEKSWKDDLSISPRGYLKIEDQLAIRDESFNRLYQVLSTEKEPINDFTIENSWKNIVADFHNNNYWNYPVFNKKPKTELTEEQKTQRELWPYLWVIIQSGIILKTLVYYFGIRASEDPTPENNIFLVLALCTSAGTLIYFAWRNFKK